MNAPSLTEYPFDGYLYGSAERRVTVRRDKFNFRPLIQSLGWVMAGATVGCTAVMLGAWGLLQLIERHAGSLPTTTTTAMVYQAPSSSPQ
jgi:hypothetical protein